MLAERAEVGDVAQTEMTMRRANVRCASHRSVDWTCSAQDGI